MQKQSLQTSNGDVLKFTRTDMNSDAEKANAERDRNVQQGKLLLMEPHENQSPQATNLSRVGQI